MADNRGKTTPGSTSGSFAPAANQRSRTQPDERVCACGQPVTTSGSHVSVCQFCWYDGTQLAIGFAAQLEQLASLTGREWKAEHTGGGCFWLATHEGDAYVAITTTDGPFEGDDTYAGVAASGAGYTIGAYRNPDDEGDYIDCDENELAATASAACAKAFAGNGLTPDATKENPSE